MTDTDRELSDAEGDADAEDRLDLGGQPGPEADEAGGKAERCDREEVEDPLDVADMAAQIGEIVGKQCANEGIPMPALSFEPGRAIVGPAGITLYEVGTVKAVELDGGAVRTYVSVDGGMSDNPRPVLYGSGYEAFLPARAAAERTEVVRLVGKHCESGDVLIPEAVVPAVTLPSVRVRLSTNE